MLHGVSFHIEPGGCFALVGESGHGKSTLARLIGRHYDPDQGAVRVDGHDLRDIELHSYRRQLGVVLQDPFLFSGTIASNIRFAKPDATDEEVAAAAAAVGVDRVAARLSGGLDHEVREGGAGLSAGERQLISIARALLADPRILVLDEATSNIDRPTEVLIEQRARPAAQGPHLDHHRPPPLDGPPRGRDPRRRERTGSSSAAASASSSRSTARSAASPTRSRAGSRNSRARGLATRVRGRARRDLDHLRVELRSRRLGEPAHRLADG